MLESVAQRLADISGQPLRLYSSFDFGGDQDISARSVLVNRLEVAAVLERIRDGLPEGVLAFIGTSRWFGQEQNGDHMEVIVAEGKSQFDILRIARSDAINYGMDTEDLIVKLREYDALHGIDIYWAETDTVAFTWLKVPTDMRTLAQSLYVFCPDLVDQGFRTLEALEQDMRTTNEVRLWWD